MNYYKSNTNDFLEFHNPIVVTPSLMTYMTHPDKSHDALQRCHECNIKYDLHMLHRLSLGKFVCKFCLNGAV